MVNKHGNWIGTTVDGEDRLFQVRSTILNFTIVNKSATDVMTLNIYVTDQGVDYLISPLDAQIGVGEVAGDKNIVINSRSRIKFTVDTECDFYFSYREEE